MGFCFALLFDTVSSAGRDDGEKRLAPPCERPLLLLLTAEGQLLGYRAFRPTGSGGVRFARLPIDWSGHLGGESVAGHQGVARMSRFDRLGEGVAACRHPPIHNQHSKHCVTSIYPGSVLLNCGRTEH